MKVSVRYFSGSGNTRFVAQRLAEVFQENSASVDCHSIEAKEADIADPDLLIIGGPIFAGNVPEKLIRWVRRKVPRTDAAEAILFSTSAGLVNAHGVHSLRKKLEKKGYAVRAMETFVMPRSYYFGRYEPTSAVESRKQVLDVENEVRRITEKYFRGTEKELPFFKKSVLALDLAEEFFSIMARGMGKKFSAGPSCTSCGKCAASCPQGNIHMDKGMVFFGRNCMLCTRCLHGCPAEAVQYDGKSYARYPGPEKYWVDEEWMEGEKA